MIRARRTTSHNRSQPNKLKQKKVSEDLSKFTLYGEICTWKPPRGGTNLTAILQALKDTGLDDEVAKTFTPQHAFSRACKAMEEARAIDTLPKDGSWLRFQFTKKSLINDGLEFEIDFKKETIVRVNETTGEVRCKVSELKELAERELKKSLEVRNGSDITTIVVKLFEQQLSELIHVDAGVYFVPAEYSHFTAQIDQFLRKLGGSVNRFPVPKGTQSGDKSVQDAVASHFESLIADHKSAIGMLSIFSKQNALDSAAERINETRVKVEAYAQYMSDRREDLLKSLDDANEDLRKQVEQLSQTKSALPERNGELIPKDRFGYREGTRAALLNSVIGEEPKSVEEISFDSGCGDKHAINGHLWLLRNKGLVEKTLDGKYKVTKDLPKPKKKKSKKKVKKVVENIPIETVEKAE